MIIKIMILIFAIGSSIYAVKAMCKNPLLWPLCGLLYVLPFWCGGFYALSCAAVSVFLLVYLIQLCLRRKYFQLHLSDPLLAVIAITTGTVLTVIWAADRGAAPWGVIYMLPVLLFTLVLLQLEKEQCSALYCLVPLSGAVMTIVSFVMHLIPATSDQVSVAGRLAGFFEYPNVYAAFLLTGLMISATEEKRDKQNMILDSILIFGIFESGSRTVFVLLVVLMVILCAARKERKLWFGLWSAFAICIAWSLVLPLLGGNDASDRYMLISADSNTFLGRLLYYADALKIIATHPLGLGYGGYRAVQGAYQTGFYDVAYVHNGLLQLFLDVGWIPATAMAWAILHSLLSKQATLRQRLLILTIAGHSMLDFDLEYLSMWLILLPALQFHQPKPIQIRKGGKPAMLVGAVAVAVCLWLAVSDSLYRNSQLEWCLKVTPFHSQAQIHQLTTITDAELLDRAADQILELNPHCSVAYSAKANAASAMGDAGAMVEAKKKAISCARYHLNEYLDYFDKLHEVMLYYQSIGDTESASVCMELLQEIPIMLEDVRASTSPLAAKLGDQPELVLPEAYQNILADLAS